MSVNEVEFFKKYHEYRKFTVFFWGGGVELANFMLT